MDSVPERYINNERTYHHSEHITYGCQYHVVFCPKYRRKVLVDDVAVRCRELFTEISEQFHFSILEMEIMPEHVHLLIACNPKFGIYKCVTRLKGKTSRILRDEFPHLKTKLPTLWTHSCFISSVGDVSVQKVREYILNQEKS